MNSSPAPITESAPPAGQGGQRASTALRLDFCTHQAARYAVEKWYYRSEMPRGKLVRIGVWEQGAKQEQGVFCGVVIFGMGASADLGKRWGLTCFQCCEMVRVALGPHTTSVSRIVSIAVRLLKKQSPGVRAVVSFSDPSAGHVGTIYQAMNWVYTGKTATDKRYITRDGTEYHSRNVSPTGFKVRVGVMCKCPKPKDCTVVDVPGKHRYVLPLDEEVRTRVEKFAMPYPKREMNNRAGGDTSDTPPVQGGEGGSIPTPALEPSSRGVNRLRKESK